MEDAVRLIEGYVRHYNRVRLHSAIGHVTPADKMCGRDKQIFDDRDEGRQEAALDFTFGIGTKALNRSYPFRFSITS